jgi:flagellar biosynthesis GTPase FlhF
MRSLFILLCCIITTISYSQTPTYDDITFDEEEIGAAFKASSKQHITLKSKKGTGGMPKVPEADALKGADVTDIILVFSETTEDAAATREENNRERWENLLSTYPEFFQFSTNYKNVCQCAMGGDAEALKTTQGFYIYYKTAEQKAAEKAAQQAAKAAAEKKEIEAAKTSEKKEEKKETKKEESKKEESKKEEKVAKSEKKEKEKEVEQPKEEKKKKKEEEKKEEEDVETSTAIEGQEETVTVEIKPKRQGYKKPKVSKDKKACRPPCYGNSDEDLHIFFKEQIVLDKKTRRAVKGSQCIVKLSLNFDGSVKKALVNGTNTKLNAMVTAALSSMDLWYPAVKGGVTVKSEVKLTLQYDKSTKAIKPMEIMITPRPNPKCTECKTDAEIFGE